MSAARIDPIEPERWLEFARDDLAYGESGMADHPRPAAWSFQQAGEKSLKAVFLHRGLKVPRTHDVAFLLSILVESMAVAPGVGDAALALAAISPASRYPDDLMEISQNDAFELARASRLVFDWARDQCRPSQPSQ
jgi:HEPN domain-containing protein